MKQHERRRLVEVPAASVPTVSERARHRVLLVEDHAALAEATAELLRFHGLDVRVATCGSDALEMAGEFRPVLVLCDIMLPDMTALEVVRALRARRGASDLLIAVVSALSPFDLRELERQWKSHGIDLFLSKPFTNDTLSGLVSMLEAAERLRADAV